MAMWTPSYAAPIRLTALDADVFPVGDPGGVFPVTDVNNLFGQGAGASFSLSAASVTLLMGSGIPGANDGTLDPVSGTFSMNWGFLATLDVLDSGNNMVGSAEVRGVLPETGTFDPLTLTGTSQTSGFVSTSMDLFSGGMLLESGLPLGIININIVALTPTGVDTFAGLFTDPAPANAEIQLQFPADLGGAIVSADLEGTFQVRVVPEPSTLLLSATGVIALSAFGWRRWQRAA